MEEKNMGNENFRLENQADELTQPVIKEENTLPVGGSFFKDNWKKLVALFGVVIVVIGFVVGIIFSIASISCNIREKNIEKQLNGLIFQDVYESYLLDWSTTTLSFKEDGRYVREYHSYATSNEDITKHVLEYDTQEDVADIKVPLFGKPTFNTYYEIIFDDDGNIEALKHRNSDSRYELVNESSAPQKLKETAVDVFCELTMWKNSNFGKMISTIYKDYDVTCEAIEGSKTKYLLTFDGEYYPNKKDVPDFTCPGTLAVEVDIEEKTGKIIKDEGVTDAMDVYLILSQVW